MTMKKSSGNMPQTEQRKYEEAGIDTSPNNAVPRCTEFDLETVPSRTRLGAWGDEQTFKVSRRGNCVTRGGNY
jgi:hypothetical protein